MSTAIEVAMGATPTNSRRRQNVYHRHLHFHRHRIHRKIKTLNLNVKARIERVENPSGKGPQFRIFSGSVELGAAWPKTAKDTERDYLSVKLDDPSFPNPIYTTLVEVEVEGEVGLQLIWSRPNRD